MRNAVTSERHPLLGVLLLATSALVVGSLLSSAPWPGVGPFLGLPPDACGKMGRFAAYLLLDHLGLPLSAWICWSGLRLGLRCLATPKPGSRRGLIMLGVIALLASVLAGAFGKDAPWGSIPAGWGEALRSRSVLGTWGAPLLLSAALVCALLVALPRLLPAWLLRLFAVAAAVPALGIASLAARVRAAVEERAARADSPPPAPREPKEAKAKRKSALDPVLVGRDADEPTRGRGAGGPDPLDDPDLGVRESNLPSRPRAGDLSKQKRPDSRSGGSAPKPAKASASTVYKLPPVTLLEEDREPPAAVDREEVLENGRTLVRALRDFGIQGQMGQIHPGPVITQYEFEPAAGVKISQIVSRAEDLALALKASRVRLVAPIPGKAAVGIEVPNRQATKITLSGLLHEMDLAALPGELPLVLGRDIRGRGHATRLDAMPHMLVAGTTGSGKSVCLNTLLLSLLFRRTPDDLRLLLIDPKMLELTPYDGIPHLLYPVITEPKMAARMMQWLVTEMERRYRKMAAVGVRNIDGYRKKVDEAKGATDGLEPMPYIVVIVDELADLMLTVANEIEGPIMRLAQMARAVGIHLVLATQRPSVDVLTGVIKANFPARIAFQVASKVDSRTILDANGAESLLGKGDMLFLPPGKAEATRVHGAFVSERDTEAVVAFLREQPPAPPLIREDTLTSGGEESGMEDDLFEDALRLVVTQRMASTSFLQRRLKVGYSRAGRLMDLLEQSGAVGAQDGSKAREVLADERFLDAWLARQRERASGVAP